MKGHFLGTADWKPPDKSKPKLTKLIMSTRPPNRRNFMGITPGDFFVFSQGSH
jgi:hypothetical protein